MMQTNDSTLRSKLTVLVSLGIMGLLLIGGFTYYAFAEIKKVYRQLQLPDKKIHMLSQLLNHVNESDVKFRLYSITSNEEYFEDFKLSNDSVYYWIDEYKKSIVGDSLKMMQMDSINSWWDSKVRDNHELLTILNKKPDIIQISEIIDATRDTTFSTSNIKEKKTIRDSFIVIKRIPVDYQEKRGFLRKIFSKKEDEDILEDSLSADSINVEMYSYSVNIHDTLFTDTIVRLLPVNPIQKSKVKNVIRRTLEYDTIYNSKRLAIIEKDFRIRSKIEKQIANIKTKEEVDSSIERGYLSSIIEDTINRIIWIDAVIAILCMLLYAVLLWDIRKIKIFEIQLVSLKEKFEQLANNRSRFLSIMSHEIRTPLHSIIGFSKILKSSTTSVSKKNQYIDIVYNASQHLLETVNLLLDRGKIESGKIEIELSDCDIRLLAEEVTDTLRVQAEEKRIGLVLKNNLPKDYTIVTDGFRLKQVLYNLVGNAIKFTSEGEVVLLLDLISTSDTNAQILFSIQDTGVGIPQEKMDVIFEEFSQQDVSTGRLFGGTGLGLAVSKKLVELLGGSLYVKSAIGKGSEFYFYLNPLLSKPSNQVKESVWKDVDSLKNISLKLLLIEDDDTNILYIHQLLKDNNITIVTATTTQEVVKELGTFDFDIVLSDLYLKDQNTSKLFDFTSLQVPVIFMSADYEALQVLSDRHDILKKPFLPESLYQSLQVALRGHVLEAPSKQDSLDTNKIFEADTQNKVQMIQSIMDSGSIEELLMLLHQLKSTLGYTGDWKSVGEVQRIESDFAIYQDEVKAKASIVELCKRLSR